MENIDIEELRNILNKEEFNELIIQMIIDLEKKYYKILMLNHKSNELFDKPTKSKNKTKKIREKIKLLENILVENNIKINNFYFSKSKIIELDYRFKIKTYNLFILLKYEKNNNKKLKVLNELREKYIKTSNQLSQFNYIDESEKYRTKDLVKQILKFINNEYRYLKNNTKQSTKIIEKK